MGTRAGQGSLVTVSGPQASFLSPLYFPLTSIFFLSLGESGQPRSGTGPLDTGKML